MGIKILVIGDSCTDAYVYGRCDRLCPAAPVPVFVPIHRKENRGMAGNVYENVLSLGVECDLLTNEVNTVVKTRYVEDKTNHMIMRLDKGDSDIRRIDRLDTSIFKGYDAIIISDYNKGYLLEEDIESISNNHNLVFLDTKKLLGNYARNCVYTKINEYEYEKTKHLIPVLGDWVKKSLIVTLGSKGCMYKDKIYSVNKVEIKDLVGAGDTFLASFVYMMLQSNDIDQSLNFANECATKVVQKRGVNVI